jgi:hypothetical protein
LSSRNSTSFGRRPVQSATASLSSFCERSSASWTFATNVEAVRARFLSRLTEVNQDYRGAASFIPEGKEPTIEFYGAGEGPFAGYDIRLEHKCVRSEKRADGGAPMVASEPPMRAGN